MGLESLRCEDSDESDYIIVDAEQMGKDTEKSELDTPKPKIFARLNYDIKRMHISPDGQYLIVSTCQDEYTNPYLLIWHIDNVLESQNKFACDDNALILKTASFNRKKIEFLNKTWILSIDSFQFNVNGTQKWCICAGSIVGDLFVWFGDVDEKTNHWNFASAKYYDFQLSFNYTLPIYLQTLKIAKNPNQKDLFHVYTGVYDQNKEMSVSNGIKTHAIYDWIIGIDNTDLVLSAVNPLSGATQHIDGISALDYNFAKDRLYSAGWDRKVVEWDIKNKTSKVIGTHHEAITELRLINLGEEIVTSSIDKSILIWNPSNPKSNIELLGAGSAITSFDIQKNKRSEKVIISASDDNHINVWDVDHNISTQIISLDDFKGVSGNFKNERGLDLISQLIIAPDNKFVFIAKKHKILLFLSYGMIIPNYIRHFYSQIQYIKETDPAFYEKIYGDNLRQIALKSDKDQDDLMFDFYQLMKQRLVQSTGKSDSEYIHRLLGSVFIPNFVKFEKEVDPYQSGAKNSEQIISNNLEKRKNQKEYIASVVTRYSNYWHSVRDMFNIMLPNLTWRFHLFVSTDLDDHIMKTKWTEIKTEEKSYKPIEILMKDRKQTALRFLMTLERVPTTLIPLVKSITINIEDDHGDAATMDFSDFVYADNFIDKNDHSMKHIYYSLCTFKIDEGYATEDNATLFIRKISVKYEDTLNPNSNDKNKARDKEIFESFRDNFFYPHMPNVVVQVGKGLSSAVGKKADDFLSKLVLIGVVFTFIDIINLLGTAPDLSSIPNIIIYALGWIGAIILTFVLASMLFKKK
jgi:WD40 repeat protein